MNNSGLMSRGQRVGNLNRDVQRLVEVEGVVAQALAQGFAFDKLSRDHERGGGLANLVDGDDVRMIKGRCRAGLLLEAVQTVGILRYRGRQQLERHFATQSFVLGQIDFTHPAAVEESDDLV